MQSNRFPNRLFRLALALLVAFGLVAAACGSDGIEIEEVVGTQTTGGDDAGENEGVEDESPVEEPVVPPNPETDDGDDILNGPETGGGEGLMAEEFDEQPIPVEPDGGIGDGAGPPPGIEDEPPVPTNPSDEGPVEPTPVTGPAPTDEPDGPTGPVNDAPIPVEPDGGIGDGAGPPPGIEEDPAPEGDWHGAQLAETNCPGMTFTRIQASAFSFSVPTDFEDQQAQGTDSEVGTYFADGFEVDYDYGWYSNPLQNIPGILETSSIDYSGIEGRKVVIDGAQAGFVGELAGVHFTVSGDDLLTLTVRYDDPTDRFVAECILGSIEWN